MKTLLKLTTPLLLAACAGLGGPPPQTGDTMAVVTAKLGQPSNTYQLDHGTELEYASGPWGQTTWMARFGPDGRLSSYEQVLTSEQYATIKIGQSTERDVLLTLGRPYETSYLALPKLKVWSYRYKESGVWDSLMHVHFDHDGIVRMMLNAPDMEKEERWRFLH